MSILFRIHILALVLGAHSLTYATVSGFDARQECDRVFHEPRSLFESFIDKNQDLYRRFRDRLDKDHASHSDIDREVWRTVSNWLTRKGVIENSPHYDGRFATDRFLKGLFLWVPDYERLKKINELLLRESDHLIGEQARVSDFEFFAVGMAWVAEQYEQFQDHARYLGSKGQNVEPFSAARIYRSFQEKAQRYNMYFTDSTMRLFVANAIHGSEEDISALGVRVSADPISSLQLKLGNARSFSVFNLTTGKGKRDLYVARHISQVEPREIFLGIGDEMVRQFFRMFRITEGRMVQFPQAADFFSVYPENTPSGYAGVIRELKWNHPTKDYTVDVANALNQIYSSWASLHDVFKNDLPIGIIELVIPQRASALGPHLGNGFSIGNEVIPNVFYLLDQGKPVRITVGGITLDVYIREMPMSVRVYLENLR